MTERREDILPMKTPTADEVREIMRVQNRKVAIFAVAFLLLGSASIWFSASGRAASQDSANATAASLANNARQSCISERYREESSATGEMLAALGIAQIAGFFLQEDEVVLEQKARFEAAAADRAAASASLQPEAVNAHPSKGGCGAPITEPSDIPDN